MYICDWQQALKTDLSLFKWEQASAQVTQFSKVKWVSLLFQSVSVICFTERTLVGHFSSGDTPTPARPSFAQAEALSGIIFQGSKNKRGFIPTDSEALMG